MEEEKNVSTEETQDLEQEGQEQEQQAEEETPEQKMERLEKQNVEVLEKNQQLLNEHSQVGRRNKELLERQNITDQTVAKLTESIKSIQQPKEETDEFVDLTDRAKAKLFINQEISSYVNGTNKAQTEYDKQYEIIMNDLVVDNGMSADERKRVYEILETQKDNIFDDAPRDAKHNLDLARLKFLEEERTSGGTKKKVNLAKEKPVGTGVGGKGTVTDTKKTVEDSPQIAKLKGQFATFEKMNMQKVKA